MIEMILTHGARIPERNHNDDTGADLEVRGFQYVIDEKLNPTEYWFDDETQYYNKDINGKKYILINPNAKMLFKTGVHIQARKIVEEEHGYVIYDSQIRGRSGNNLKTYKEIENGTIDRGYINDLGVVLHNEGNYAIKVYENEKLAQWVIGYAYIPKKSSIKIVDKFSETSRGVGGFGTTEEKLNG